MSMFEKRVEANAEAIYDWQTGTTGKFNTSFNRETWLRVARYALKKVDAVVTEEMIEEKIRALSFDDEDCEDIAHAVLALFRGGAK